MAATKTDVATDVTTDVITDAVYSAETVATAHGGLSSSYSSADAETTVHGVHQMVVAAVATMATTTIAAVLSSGSSYYPASAETEAFSNFPSMQKQQFAAV